MSRKPIEFAVGHTPNVIFQGIRGCTQVVLEMFDEFGNPATDHITADFLLMGAGKLFEAETEDERIWPIKDGRCIFYLDSEATLRHDRYVPTVSIRVDGSWMNLNIHTMKLQDPRPNHIVFRE